jgi:hypothetical protein
VSPKHLIVLRPSVAALIVRDAERQGTRGKVTP